MEKDIAEIRIALEDGGVRLYGSTDESPWLHPLWLRERAEGADAVDSISGQRLYDPAALAPKLTVSSVNRATPNKVDVTFDDGGQYHLSMSKIAIELGLVPDPQSPPVPEIWDQALSPRPEADWNEMDDPTHLRDALDGFFRCGYTVFRNTPTQPGSLKHLAEKFGYIRETNFGVLFDVLKKQEASDLAYTNSALAPHTDNPYRTPIPGIQFLHCLKNSVSGGLSTLVDGFAIARKLEEEAPEQAEILAKTMVRFRYEAVGGAIMENTGTLIERDITGRTIRIRLSSRLDYVPAMKGLDLDLFYAARRRLQELANDPAFVISNRFVPGMLLMMDNYRTLHGRTVYDAGDGQRHLQGCYIDHDGPDSLYRMLVRDGAGMVMRNVE